MARRLLIALLLGLLTNVIIAWWVAPPPTARTVNLQRNDFTAEWQRLAPAEWPDPHYEHGRWHAAHPGGTWEVDGSRTTLGIQTMRVALLMSPDEPPLTIWTIDSSDFGWPLRCIARDVATLHMQGVTTQTHGFRILLPGTAGNIVIFSGIWVVAILAICRRRWSQRLRRHRCPNCAYPIGKSERCTECGSDLITARNTPPSSTLRRALAGVLLGIATTALIAWFAPWAQAGSPWRPIKPNQAERLWRHLAPDDWARVRHVNAGWQVTAADGSPLQQWQFGTRYFPGLGLQRLRLVIPSVDPPGAMMVWDTMTIKQQGWPLRTLASERLSDATGDRYQNALRPRKHYALPTRPLWAGMITNTIFYALLWLGFFTISRRPDAVGLNDVKTTTA